MSFVGQARAASSRAAIRHRLDDVADLEHLLDRDRRLAIRMRLGRMLPPCHHLLRPEIDGCDMGRTGLAVEQR